MNRQIKKIILITFILLSFTGCVEREYFDDTGAGPPISGLFKEIEGSISGTLTSEDSPYYVKDHIIVDSSSALYIEPGVELYFETGKTLIVKGELKAIGERFARIYFLPYRFTWEGIKILSADSETLLQFCFFKGIVSTDPHYYGSILIYGSDVSLRNCYFEKNIAHTGGAIGSLFSTVEIMNVIFNANESQNVGGAVSAQYSDIKLINNVFNQNKSPSLGAGVIIRNPFRTEIQNHIFYKNFYGNDLSHLVYLSPDTTNYIEQYNYIATGNMNPFFISDNNFRLIFASPCRNAGNPAPEFNNTDGSRNDQGAYGGLYGNW
ncbi:MAG TPA: hypothetical protein VK870_07780 [Ignavibacteriaceae bacterium]|nr:hypothetical protein [Ignavibacteriaceae bacterium]